jgi:glycosyltransferase involved in cell wall biosynthesis
MLTVSYITRPYFNDIALELIEELKHKCILNVIIIISPWNIDYLNIQDDSIKGFGKPFKLTDQILNKIYLRYASYFDGANVIIKYEEHKQSSLKNPVSWMRLLLKNKNILKADIYILESLGLLADWYFLFRIRNKRIYYIMHDPLPHTGEKGRSLRLIRNIFFNYVDKFLLYSSSSTDLFNSNFPKYVGKTITLQTPIYRNLKIPVQVKEKLYKTKVLFFGRISPYKGVELFYSAAEYLSKEFNDVLFIIAGKSLKGYFPRFLNNNSNPNIQIINEFIDLDTLSQLMTESSYCVLPYLDATQSGVVMTAYAYDLPVLVSDCPGLLEYCFDVSNFSFKSGELNDLISKMHELLVNDSLLQGYKRSIALYSNMDVSEKNALKILES